MLSFISEWQTPSCLHTQAVTTAREGASSNKPAFLGKTTGIAFKALLSGVSSWPTDTWLNLTVPRNTGPFLNTLVFSMKLSLEYNPTEQYWLAPGYGRLVMPLSHLSETAGLLTLPTLQDEILRIGKEGGCEGRRRENQVPQTQRLRNLKINTSFYEVACSQITCL